MAPFLSLGVWQQKKQLFLLLIASLWVIPHAVACYTSVFSFGDSLADTGNRYFSSDGASHSFFPPYGETYFGHPTGRSSNGRLIIDFISQALGIPFLKPYLGIKIGTVKDWSIEEGVNFAVAGATALDVDFLKEKDVLIRTNYSLKVQLHCFKEFLSYLFNHSSSSTRKFLGSSLFLVGEIGGNDYNHAFEEGKSIEEVHTFVPFVINTISSTISELIDLGAQTVLVPGNLPLGCNAIFLTLYESKNIEDYDAYGCLKWLNKFAEYHNEKLYSELVRLQELNPSVNIIYADYYNAALSLYHSPQQYGFIDLKACCGSGGPYNYNASAVCGEPGLAACDDPSQYISWDGVHLTEAAYEWIAKGLSDGTYTVPRISTLCVSQI
ncbi:hypothetical protein L6164_036806 [Bauhinia variegata]|uniref:Uncharacterized protein n=1 Tax=Bauhinia variegata TaxID=167791 RepID=A0ACB9KIA3_BAUVA|nr:hypothetical protein L6164_036806 [Bauhinia variegata]